MKCKDDPRKKVSLFLKHSISTCHGLLPPGFRRTHTASISLVICPEDEGHPLRIVMGNHQDLVSSWIHCTAEGFWFLPECATFSTGLAAPPGQNGIHLLLMTPQPSTMVMGGPFRPLPAPPPHLELSGLLCTLLPPQHSCF